MNGCRSQPGNTDCSPRRQATVTGASRHARTFPTCGTFPHPSPSAYAADTPVQRLHLVHGSDAATEMYLSWMTPGAVADPSVELAGAARVAAVSAQYAGYPGFFHHAPITGPSISSSVTSPM